jgi:hypothetical protein
MEAIMKRVLLPIGLLATLSILSLGSERQARADGGADAAAEGGTDAAKDSAPPKDTAPPKDAASTDTSNPDGETPDGEPEETGPGPDGGLFVDVIIADGGESTDSTVPPSPTSLPPTDDSGLDATGGSGGCSVSTLTHGDRVTVGLALVLGAIVLGAARQRRRRP